MNDTTRRFLTAIVDRIPDGGQIVELRLFPAIRQSGIESGVAVLAVETRETPAPGEVMGEVADREPDGDGAAVDGDADIPDVDADADVPDVDPDADVSDVDPDDDVMDVDPDDDVLDVDGPPDAPASGPSAVEEEPGAAAVASGGDASLAPELAYAAAACALVDTDVAVEEEEGGVGDDVDATRPSVPHADAVEDEAVGSALDEEMQRIVVDATRDIVAAEARAAAHASPPSTPGSVPVVSDGDGPAGSSDDDSPYADAIVSPDGGHRPIAVLQADGTAADGSFAGVALDDPRVDDIRLDDILALPSPDGAADAVPADASAAPASAAPLPIQRYAILTARYRLTLKGPDRGKWDVEITHEADAPLATLERVARGVAKRAGDESDPEHFSAESLRQALDAPAWITTT